ncbi:hypothetical protein [Actinomycetospora sp. CA-084318]|uniref:hypothetical protein n=1 Tax=Actinomycetospora sp. CA-084318 TaxID=3239892 RepID=UPI003D97B59E
MTVEEPATVEAFDVLAARAHSTIDLDLLLADHPEAVLAVRREAAVAWLATPSRGPGPAGTRAVVAVLRVLGPTPALERAWLRWIEEGRFDGHPDDEAGASARDLVDGLRHCVEHGVFGEDHALVHGALAHWSGLLRSPEPDRRRRGLSAVAAMVASGRRFPSALPGVVTRALRDDPTDEAARSQEAVNALFDR